MASKYDTIFSIEDKNKIIDDYINNGLSIKKICEKYNIPSRWWVNSLIGDKARTISEAVKNAHTLYPSSFKHTEETKELMSFKRLKYMKEHPEDTIWRKRNEPSYPEKCFIKFLTDYGYSEKYYIERERSVFPYYIDFAFLDAKVAVEIDGSQHILDEEQKERDKKKDELLNSLGWKVLRITAKSVKRDWDDIKEKLDPMLSGTIIENEKVGVFKCQSKKYEKVKRGEDGLSDKQRNAFFNRRKVVERPSKNQLLEILSKSSFEAVARTYRVSSGSIRKWCKAYKIPYHIKEIKNMADSSIGRTQDSQS